ncbi:unnamed protein product, partial [Darwinula stevensoni]
VANYTIPGASNIKSWNYTLTGLIPNTNYEVTIRAIVEGAEFSDLWSNSSRVKGKTKPKDRSPDTPLGSFHVERIDDSLRNISLYWIPLSDWEHYSDNFTYLYRLTRHLITTNIGIPCPTIQNKTSTHDGEYILEWRALEEEKTTNFTVFWCSSHPAWPNCDSNINWQVVSKKTTTFGLKSNESLKFAISANGESGSGSGMGWEKIVFESKSGCRGYVWLHFKNEFDCDRYDHLSLAGPSLVYRMIANVGPMLCAAGGIGNRLILGFDPKGIPQRNTRVSMSPQLGHGGIVDVRTLDQYFSMAALVITVVAVALVVSAALGGNRLWKHLQEPNPKLPGPLLKHTYSLPYLGKDAAPLMGDTVGVHRRRNSETGTIAYTSEAYVQVGIQKEVAHFFQPDGGPPSARAGSWQVRQNVIASWRTYRTSIAFARFLMDRSWADGGRLTRRSVFADEQLLRAQSRCRFITISMTFLNDIR